MKLFIACATVALATQALAQTFGTCDVCGSSDRSSMGMGGGELTSITFRYTGSNVGANNNQQGSGKWGFSGNPPAGPVVVRGSIQSAINTV